MIIGITGGIGSGKSTIVKELAKRGFAVYDCDREAKRIITENKQIQKAIIELLGEDAFLPSLQGRDGGRLTYNTAFVAKRVFAEPELLSRLNAIVHPAVKADIMNKQPDFIESAILFEAALDAFCDKVIVVEAPEEIRIARVIARDYNNAATPENIDKVRARMQTQQKSPASQAATQGKIFTVVNDGSLVLSRIVDLVCHIAAH